MVTRSWGVGRKAGEVSCQRVAPGILVMERICVPTVVVVVTPICIRDNIAENEICTSKHAWIPIKLVNWARPWTVSVSVSCCAAAL